MNDDHQDPVRKRLNTWVQTIGIIIAAIWGVYEFIYKDVYIPNTTPVNVSLDLNLSKMSNDGNSETDEDRQLVPVQIKVSATNPSTRKIQLLPSQFAVYGIDMVNEGGQEFLDRVTNDLNALYSGQYQSRSTIVRARQLVAGGSLFIDNALNPKEQLIRTLIVYVDRGVYDKLEVTAQIHSARNMDGFNIHWTKGAAEPIETVTWINGDGLVVDLDKDNAEFKRVGAEKELQAFSVVSEISLW